MEGSAMDASTAPRSNSGRANGCACPLSATRRELSTAAVIRCDCAIKPAPHEKNRKNSARLRYMLDCIGVTMRVLSPASPGRGGNGHFDIRTHRRTQPYPGFGSCRPKANDLTG